eukprot:CAMPEP_0118675770 /NCGR_PEP_ID=MMETSP0800-20121206/1644_1 /TAXON_ID=210618 ORGANISM="Striatella unipunctata, Strain CCMP2910" /NCGR_SAMPLE_ID=MMETSP0800 /ASSEMBLY_ACC=CAM_ASM_000638 /LENGTH=823 /DNA_ID=CAMNT_0006571145 /DNA_START=111 /DNA_END=2582 /DNA_ORIENTATION=-
MQHEDGDKQDAQNKELLIDYCIEFCKRAAIVSRTPSKTGLLFARDGPSASTPDQRIKQEMEMSGRGGSMMRPERPLELQHSSHMRPEGGTGISATPLARRSKAPPSSREPHRDHGMSAFQPQQPMGSPTADDQMYPGGEIAESPTVRQAHPRGPQYDMHQPYPHQTGHEPPPGYQPPPYSYPPYDMPPPPQNSSYPFFQDASGSWICRYCSWLPPNYREPGSVWTAQDHSPPPPGFLDRHLSICRPYNHGPVHPTASPSQAGMYPSQGYPPHQPGYGHHPGGPPPPGWGPQGTPSPYHGGQGAMMMSPPPGPPHYAHSPSPAGMGEPPYHYNPHHDGHHGMPMPHETGQMEHPGMMPPSTPRGASTAHRNHAEGSEAAMDAAISHLMNADRENFSLEARGNAKTGGQLVLDNDKSLLTDYFFYLMKQLRVCRFSESDRKTRGGKRENIAIGYGGLQCVHCADSPNSRKFFWSNVDRLANSFAEIPGHVLKCRRCPNQTKLALAELKLRHPEQMARLPRGSQKVFFRRMWRRLHEEDTEDEHKDSSQRNAIDASPKPRSDEGSSVPDAVHVSSAHTPPTEGSVALNLRPTDESARILADAAATSQLSAERVLLAISEDKEWLSDMDCFIRSNLEVFCAIEDDVSTAQSDRKYPIKVGQVGIRCIHCAMMDSDGARGTAVSFPYSISGIYESVREFQRLHLDSCGSIPEETKSKMTGLKGSASLSSVLRNYYQHAAKALGLYDTPDGIRAGADPVPIESSAAFGFSNMSCRSVEQPMRMGGGPGPFAEAGPAITPLESRKRKPLPSSVESVRKKRYDDGDKEAHI